MTLTPDDVRNTVFRVALRGYAVDEVDAFLDRLESELRETVPDSGQDLAAAAGTSDGPEAGEPPVPITPAATPSEAGCPTEERPSARGFRLLQLAEQTAEQLVAEARSEADALVAVATAEAERCQAATEAGAERVLAAARREAEQLLAAAHADAQRLREELTERHLQESAELEHRVGALRVELDELRRQDEDIRRLLVGTLTEQLELLQGGRLRAVPAVAS